MVKGGGVFFEPREFPCDFLWGYMKTLVYSIPIDTIEILRQRVENDATATTIRSNRGRYVGKS
jgi:putative lipoic acid-binding regulatory protein